MREKESTVRLRKRKSERERERESNFVINGRLTPFVLKDEIGHF